MSIFTTRIRNKPWVWQVTAVCFVLGVLVAGSAKTIINARHSGEVPVRLGVSYPGTVINPALITKLEDEIVSLRGRNTDLENSLATGSQQTKALNNELQNNKLLAGLTDVEGPGLIVMLNDSHLRPPSDRSYDAEKYIIHDADIQEVINELLAAGAEAISVNGQRYIARTAVRCVGPAIQVNGVPLVPPYVIKAVGDPNTLYGALNLPGGVLDGMRRYDPNMFHLTKIDKMIIHAYAGSTAFHYAKPIDGDGSLK